MIRNLLGEIGQNDMQLVFIPLLKLWEIMIEI